VGNNVRSSLNISARSTNSASRLTVTNGIHTADSECHYNPGSTRSYFRPILQSPFFNALTMRPTMVALRRDRHEISHGLTIRAASTTAMAICVGDQGRSRKFAMNKALVAQYAAYEPVPGYKVNGELTLGENIADNSGLAIAHKAYMLSLQGKMAPVMDGFSGEQRFFAGWAQVWRNKSRQQEEIRLLAVDPHSPAQFRAWGAAVNQAAFYEAYSVTASDKMYLPPEQRVVIW
jgi:putative endopeptidase